MHAAFNIANSIGAGLGGATIAAGWGYNSPNLVAVGLGLLGVGIAVYAGQTRADRAGRFRWFRRCRPTTTAEVVPDPEPVGSA